MDFSDLADGTAVACNPTTPEARYTGPALARLRLSEGNQRTGSRETVLRRQQRGLGADQGVGDVRAAILRGHDARVRGSSVTSEPSSTPVKSSSILSAALRIQDNANSILLHANNAVQVKGRIAGRRE